ncbi:HIRAN domain-containing protein [Nonomuraea cavernae]|uniref:HIRAN domain-containing protein n=1 Tax=Nonomuraea cavernae TaxID=2045107 RepID=UPI0033FBBB85
MVALQDRRSRQIAPVGFLEKTDEGFAFAYLRRVMDMPGFRPLFGFADLERRYASPTLFPLFSQRLMNPQRSDYGKYLMVLGLTSGSPPLTVLGRSGGRRAGDSIFLVPEPYVDPEGHTSSVFFVHGLRHMAGAESRISLLSVGDDLGLRDDPTNPANRHALLVTREGDELGWVPDLLLDYVHHVRDAGNMTLRVGQVNGSDAPANLRLRVQLDGSVPHDYSPFRGKEWATFG